MISREYRGKKGPKPATIAKYQKVLKHMGEGMLMRYACKRVGISEGWFMRLRNELKTQCLSESTTSPNISGSKIS